MYTHIHGRGAIAPQQQELAFKQKERDVAMYTRKVPRQVGGPMKGCMVVSHGSVNVIMVNQVSRLWLCVELMHARIEMFTLQTPLLAAGGRSKLWS